MSISLLVRARVEKDVIVRISRRLSGKGKINIAPGMEVTPTDILGTSMLSSGFRTLNLAQILSAPASDVPKYLKVPLGKKIYKGELLAYKSGGLFWGKSVVVSPTDGILDFFNPKTGEVKLTLLPRKEDLICGSYGIVEKVEHEKGQIIIRTQASLVHGIFGSGRVREGILHVIGRRDQILGKPSFMPSIYHGQILVGGSLIFKEAISSCISAGITGIITGGMNAQDYKAMSAGRITFPKKLENDSGISIVVCEGFGSVPIGEDIFEILTKYQSKFAQIDGNTSTVVLPSFESKSMLRIRNTSLPDEDLRIKADSRVDLKKGMKVRCVGNSFLGEQGIVVAIDQIETRLPSQVSGLIATVETKRRKIRLPVANLEIIL